MPSIRLRTEPTVQQGQLILARVERALGELGVSTERERSDIVRFRLPLPWRATRADPLLLATSGRVRVSAGSGGPRRLRYEVSFLWLRAVGGLLTALLVVLGWGWPRMVLLGALLWLWVAVFALVATARRRMRRLLRRSAREIVERRRTPRPVTSPAPPPPASRP
ncbi:MAG TPA: hypothetical protein VFX39_06795 [Gemmatimonadaceae bacterium]|nr:hypothetical protein [Gemmatimonadaceae bacterium]